MRDNSGVVSTTLGRTAADRAVAFRLEFQLSYDLLIESPLRLTGSVIEAVAISGGIFVLLAAIFTCLFSSCLPYFMHLYIIRNLFKVDNNPRRKPISEKKLEDKNHGSLVKVA